MGSVTVKLTRTDYAACLWRTSIRHPVNRWVFTLLALVLAFGQIKGHAQEGAAIVVILLFSAFITSFLCMLVGIFVTTLGMVLLARKETALLVDHVYRIVESGLQMTSNAREGLIKWGGAHALRRTRHHIYIQLSSSACIDIPRRCFESEAADEEFWKALQPLVAKKNSGSVPGAG